MRRAIPALLAAAVVVAVGVVLPFVPSGGGGHEERAEGRKLGLLRERFRDGPADPAVWAALGRGAGGGRPVPHAAGARPRAAGPDLRLDVHPTGRTAAEPTLGITRDGTIFYVGFAPSAAQVPRSVVQRSRDGGRTWQELDPVVPGQREDTLTGDPYLHVDEDTGRVFNVDYLPPTPFLSYSDDGGETFVAGNLRNHTDHQNLFTGPPPAVGPRPSGYPNVVYYCAIDTGAALAHLSTGCSKSLDGGASFQRVGGVPYVTDASRPGGSGGINGYCTGAVGHGTVGPDGAVYLPRGFCDQPFVAVSRDQGETWTRTQVSDLGTQVGVDAGAGVEDHDAAVAVDAAGTVYYLWIARDHLPYLAVSRDGGRSFEPARMVGAPGVKEAWGAALDAGDDGRIAFSYVGSKDAPGPPYCVRTTPGGCVREDGSERPDSVYENATWDGYVGMSVDADSANPTFTSAAVSPPGDPLVRGECGPVRCQQQYDFGDVDVAPDGSAWAAFVDGCGPDRAKACESIGQGIAVQAVPTETPLVGTPADQRPAITAPPSTAPRACASRRRFRIRLRRPRRGRILSARVTVAGRRVAVRPRGGRLTATVDLRGLPRGRYVVRIRVRTTAGRTFTDVRRYRTCG